MKTSKADDDGIIFMVKENDFTNLSKFQTFLRRWMYHCLNLQPINTFMNGSTFMKQITGYTQEK